MSSLRQRGLGVFILLGLAACAGGAEPTESTSSALAQSRTIFYGGTVFTSAPEALYAEGIVVQGERVLAVGTNDEVLAYRNQHTTVYNLDGRVLIPGFNDAHAHPVPATAAFPYAVRVNNSSFVPGPGPSIAEMQALLAAGAAANPAGTWLFGAIGDAIINDPAADRYALDAVAPDHPVLLITWTGHGTILNSAALATVGIGDEEADPFGGFYERVPGTNTVSGVLHEYAGFRAWRYFFDQMSDEYLVGVYKQFEGAALYFGYTSIQEFPVALQYDRAVRIVEAAGMRPRWRTSCVALSMDEDCSADATTVDASGYKWLADGTPVERLAAMYADYTDDPGNIGSFNFPADALAQMVDRSNSASPRQNQIIVHTSGDRAIGTVLDALDAATPEDGWQGRRPRLEHADLLFPGEYDRVREMGAVVVGNPLHFALPFLMYPRFGGERVSNMSPQRSLLEQGIPYAIGSDMGFVGIPGLDLFLAVIHPTRPSEGISLEDALIAYTAGGAYAEFRENSKGTLEEGKYADLAVLSQNIFQIPPWFLPDTFSVMTMVNGEIAHNMGALQPE